MVNFQVKTGIFKIGDQIASSVVKNANEKWFDEDITILLSSVNVLATLIVDFDFDTPTIVEYTLDGGINWIAFNNGEEIISNKRRKVRVTTDVKFNIRSKQNGTLNRCIVGV